MLIYLQLLKESFNFAIKSLRDNKLRTFLSLLGVTVGIFSIISVLAAVDSLNRSIQENLAGLDKNMIFFCPYRRTSLATTQFSTDFLPRFRVYEARNTEYRSSGF